MQEIEKDLLPENDHLVKSSQEKSQGHHHFWLTQHSEVESLGGVGPDPIGSPALVTPGVTPADVGERQDHAVVGQLLVRH